MDRNESNSDKPRGRTRRRRLVAGVAVAAIAAAVVAGVRYMSPPGGLDKREIDEILKAALADKNTAPTDACVSLSGAELPADVTAASLLRVDGTVRKDVQALINRGLITVKFDAGKGKPTIRNPDYEASDKHVRLSHIELTALGKAYYRYHELESTDPSSPGGSVLYMMNLFCAHVSYGGVEKFMTPSKNPFDDNPHHRRAKLVRLTKKGEALYREADRRQEPWARRLAKELDARAIASAHRLLKSLRERLEFATEG